MKGESIASIVVAVLGLGLFTLLLLLGTVATTPYVLLVTVTGFVCLALHAFPRVREFDLRNLKMTLDQIESAKSAIYAKAEDLRRAAFILADLIVFNSEVGSRFGTQESFELQKQWNRMTCDKLLASFAASSQERENLFRYAEFFRRFDNASPEEREDFDINAMIRRDIEGMRSAQ
jgi:hypothetical protein